MKFEKEWFVKEIFSEIIINIIIEGCKYLGVVFGFRVFFEEYVDEKVEEWVV